MGRCKKKPNKSISHEFFTSIAILLMFSLTVMGCIETALSAAYFGLERKAVLTGILDSATALSNLYAQRGSVVTRPILDETQREEARSGYELFNSSANAIVFVADAEGNILLSTNSDSFTGRAVDAELLAEMDAGSDVFLQGRLSGVYTGRYYTAGRKICLGETEGYIFAATSMDSLTGYVGDMLSIFVVSGLAMMLLSSILSLIFSRRITRPIEEISDAARKLGNGDFTARAPVTGSEELAEFATTFNNMAARLQTIDNSRGQFMGNIAHELRTPMTSIKGFIDGMLDGTIPPEEQHRYLEVVSQETGRLARLVQNMLDITRLEAGEYKMNARSYDLWETLTGVALADEKRIEEGKINIEGLSTERMLVFADPDLVHQVVYNIVDNAIKFTPPGGSIRFAVKKVGNMVETSIENTGAGIAPDALPFVFERFYKEDRSRGLNTRGSGLGLHICKVLVNLSGGQIRVESEEGAWCRFTFTLPAANDPAPGGARRGG